MNPLLDAGLGGLRDAEQLDPVAQFVGHPQIEGLHPRDTLDRHALRVDRGAEGEAGACPEADRAKAVSLAPEPLPFG